MKKGEKEDTDNAHAPSAFLPLHGENAAETSIHEESVKTKHHRRDSCVFPPRFRFRSPAAPAPAVHLHSFFRPKMIRFVLNVTSWMSVCLPACLPGGE